MKLTSVGQSNITAAYSAVHLWEDIIEQGDLSSQLTSILVLGNTLFASSLSRVGRDLDAVDVLGETLSLVDGSIDDETLIDVRRNRGAALQRLMRYKEAASEFNSVAKLGQERLSNGHRVSQKISESAYSAALCSMRQGDRDTAVLYLSDLLEGVKVLNSVDSNLVGLYGVLLLELQLQKSPQSPFNALQLLEHAASSSNASLIYKWFYAVACNSMCNLFGEGINSIEEKESLLQVASINLSPFDNPALISLDDKVLLHDLLDQGHAAKSKWWPNGYILPRDQDIFEESISADTDCKWILKERAGYGSHCNRIVSGAEGLSFSKACASINPEYLVLCQKLIEPSMLFHSRKFTIRVYVVYFNQAGKNGEDVVYVLDQGLAKLAECMYEQDQTSDAVHMTNSGRKEGEGMLQYDFHDLREYVDSQYSAGSFDDIWCAVCKSVAEVMQLFCEAQRKHENSALRVYSLSSTVPKIMGFDYIIDAALQPWLLEVNRFPGLEARGECDYSVKREVILDAWRLA
ncbi:unnamed protein product, partial [Heterosigma akashiwo]